MPSEAAPPRRAMSASPRRAESLQGVKAARRRAPFVPSCPTGKPLRKRVGDAPACAR